MIKDLGFKNNQKRVTITAGKRTLSGIIPYFMSVKNITIKVEIIKRKYKRSMKFEINNP